MNIPFLCGDKQTAQEAQFVLSEDNSLSELENLAVAAKYNKNISWYLVADCIIPIDW